MQARSDPATEVIICGWRPGQNRLSGSLGGLLLGGHDPDTGDLIYIGDVGLLTGLTEDTPARPPGSMPAPTLTTLAERVPAETLGG